MDESVKQKNVVVAVFNPSDLIKSMGYNDPIELSRAYIDDLRSLSPFANYVIKDVVNLGFFPTKEGGGVITPEQYSRAVNGEFSSDEERELFNRPSEYSNFVSMFGEDINGYKYDEVWLFGGPWFGFYESRMVGRKAIYCNSSPVKVGGRTFVIMGFSYERGVGEMLEDFCHRTEFIMSRVWSGTLGNRWNNFIRYDKTHPGKSEVGSVHFSPNSDFDYDWGNPRKVLSCHKRWYDYPNNYANPVYEEVDCSEWGMGDMRAHHIWWLKHLPPQWWRFVVDMGFLEGLL